MVFHVLRFGTIVVNTTVIFHYPFAILFPQYIGVWCFLRFKIAGHCLHIVVEIGEVEFFVACLAHHLQVAIFFIDQRIGSADGYKRHAQRLVAVIELIEPGRI